VQTGLSCPDLSWPGVQIALAPLKKIEISKKYFYIKNMLSLPHGFGVHKSCGTNFLQATNGLPVISRGHEQTGVSPRRLQSAPIPQAPSHGFLQTP
jgi:hypothetical protein